MEWRGEEEPNGGIEASQQHSPAFLLVSGGKKRALGPPKAGINEFIHPDPINHVYSLPGKYI